MLYHAPYYSFGINPCCWSKVFKKELLEQCLYPVTPKVKIGEDAAFTYPCLLAAESLAYVDGCLYHYRNNAQSMTNTYDRLFQRQFSRLFGSIWSLCFIFITNAFSQ